jgi:Glycosyltransferase like family
MISAPRIRLVCATRRTEEDFYTHSALGRSLAMYKPLGGFDLSLFSQNTLGLPKVYNQAISKCRNDPSILIFVHDDVYLCDFYWPGRVLQGLNVFGILGVAGNKRRIPKQPSWAKTVDIYTWDMPENLSGMVGHGNGFPPRILNFFGPSAQEVKLLDGLMLISHSDTLNGNSLYFDEQFDFHFYDMDFCRQAELKGIKMGTWPISIIHESEGKIEGDISWEQGYQRYLDKWQS